MDKKTAARSGLGALLLLWWAGKQAHPSFGWLDLAVLVGLALGWLLERQG